MSLHKFVTLKKYIQNAKLMCNVPISLSQNRIGGLRNKQLSEKDSVVNEKSQGSEDTRDVVGFSVFIANLLMIVIVKSVNIWYIKKLQARRWTVSHDVHLAIILQKQKNSPISREWQEIPVVNCCNIYFNYLNFE